MFRFTIIETTERHVRLRVSSNVESQATFATNGILAFTHDEWIQFQKILGKSDTEIRYVWKSKRIEV